MPLKCEFQRTEEHDQSATDCRKRRKNLGTMEVGTGQMAAELNGNRQDNENDSGLPLADQKATFPSIEDEEQSRFLH